MFPRKLSGFGAAAKSFPVFALFVPLCGFARDFLPLPLASLLIPFSFFLQEAYRFFHRRAGNDWNVGRIMELTDYG
jgi:hypothetical protein